MCKNIKCRDAHWKTLYPRRLVYDAINDDMRDVNTEGPIPTYGSATETIKSKEVRNENAYSLASD